MEKSIKTKASSFEKISETDKPLIRLIGIIQWGISIMTEKQMDGSENDPQTHTQTTHLQQVLKVNSGVFSSNGAATNGYTIDTPFLSPLRKKATLI